MFLCMIRPRHDDFSSGVSMNGIVHFVLDSGEKVLGDLAVQRVVHRRGIDVGDLLIKPALTGSDLLNLGDQVVKVIFTEYLTVYEAILVKHIALLREGVQHLSRPLAELGRPLGIGPIAHGDNGGQSVELIPVGLTVIRNLCKKCTS